jgi:hypothetical protein
MYTAKNSQLTVIKSSETPFKTEAVILGTAPEKTLHVSDYLKIHPYSTRSSNGGSSVSKKAINIYTINLQYLKHSSAAEDHTSALCHVT